MLRFKEAVVIRYQSPYCNIYLGTHLYEIEDLDSYFFNILKKRVWKLESLSDEMKDFLIKNFLVINQYEIKNIDEKLIKNIHFFENKTVNYISNPILIQNNICEKKVIILGCGGIGTVVLKNLISFGVKDFLIIEFDIVEESNLNRQLFFNSSHVGDNKGIAIKQLVREYSEGITVNTVNIKINRVEDLQLACKDYNADFFVNCADTPSDINKLVFDYCKPQNIPFIQGAVGVETGYWGPIFSRDYSTANIFSQDKKESIIGSISSTNMTIGALMSNDILEFWINDNQENLYKRKSLNFSNYTMEIMEK